jgi:outer membrane protein, heavy metal efflux system
VTMQDERNPRSAALAAALDLQTDGVLPWPVLKGSAHLQVDENALMGMIEQLNPELKALDLMTTRAEYAETLARREYFPDIMLGAGLMGGPGTGTDGYMWNPGVIAGISLPLWTAKNRAVAQEATALRLSVADSKQDKLILLMADLKMATFQYRDAERRLALYRDSIVPKARQALDAVLQDYSAGRAEFMSLLNSQRSLLNAQLGQERAAVDFEIAMAEIGCCVGKYKDVMNP